MARRASSADHLTPGEPHRWLNGGRPARVWATRECGGVGGKRLQAAGSGSNGASTAPRNCERPPPPSGCEGRRVTRTGRAARARTASEAPAELPQQNNFPQLVCGPRAGRRRSCRNPSNLSQRPPADTGDSHVLVGGGFSATCRNPPRPTCRRAAEAQIRGVPALGLSAGAAQMTRNPENDK